MLALVGSTVVAGSVVAGVFAFTKAPYVLSPTLPSGTNALPSASLLIISSQI